MLEHSYAVIMAGGGGTRLWPLSRKKKPKQMLKLFGDRTLFQIAVDRLKDIFPPERICVVTVAEQALELQQECPQIPVENYFLEPMPRGTASVVGLAAAILYQRDPQACMAVLTADHYINNIGLFSALLEYALRVANDGFLVTLGIRPTFPSTGYGYIERGKKLPQYQSHPVFEVSRFKEKPDAVTAVEMVKAGIYDWNSGMFIWKVERILKEFEHWMPDLFDRLMKIQAAWGAGQQSEVLNHLWPDIKAETIDYGIMEHATNTVMIPAEDLGWNDVGSWESLFEVQSGDENGNIVIDADYQPFNSRNSLICSDTNRRKIITIGVSDMVVVDTGDALLICGRNEAQNVRDVVNWLKEKNLTQYL
jgi:mannose-1-phosphate guanylyltransferase